MRFLPFRSARIRATASRLYREGGVSAVARWLETSRLSIDDLRHAFRKDPLALQIIEDYVNPKPPQRSSNRAAEDDGEFVRAVKAHLAGVRASPFYETHLSHFLDTQNVANLLRWFIRYRSLEGVCLLDDGCGVGGFLEVSRELGAARSLGVEIELPLARLAQLRLKDASSSHVVVAEGESLPFAAQSFDVVLSSHVLEHVHDPDRYMSEITRVLKPGGSLFLACPNRLWPKEPHSQLRYLTCLPNRLVRWLCRILFTLGMGSAKRREQFYVATQVARFVSPFTVRRLASRYRLRMMALNPVERFTEAWPMIARRFSRSSHLLAIAALLLSPEILAVMEKGRPTTG